MWIYKVILGFFFFFFLFFASCSGGRRNALQDYQMTDAVRLVLASPDSSLRTKSRKISLSRCAKSCSRNKRLPFLCRAFLYDNEHRKCQWLSYDKNTPSVDSQRDLNYQLYQKKDYVRECIVGTGQGYRGRRSVTVSGIMCQAWANPIPHEHKFMHKRYRRKDLSENYCRNPDNSTAGPWCFTNDPALRHQECGIPQCSQVECMNCNGEDYRGPMDHTESGKECQRWDLSEPHKHLYHSNRYPDKGLDDNYCRNPDGRHRPWCFTTDPNTPWEYCNIKVCESPRQRNLVETTECYQGRGEGYRGTIDVTPAGLTCQRWDSQYPHNHTFRPEAYPCKDLRENYCRNPDGQEFPWCFTTDPRIRTMLCTNIPQCGSQNKPVSECYRGFGENYQGQQSKTRFNLPCASWSDHSTSDERGVLEGNYCRNPDKDKHGPWCYTNNSALTWDYCNIKPCDAPQSPVPQGESLSCFIHKSPRIVGGGPVNISDGSWMVSIQKGSMHWCGGSLIREEWVLTDRQCFSSCVPDLSEYRVWLGVSDIRDGASDRSKRQEVSIAHIICGPEGSSLALIRLSKPALPADNVHTIHLPVAGCSIAGGMLCKMYGWGETKGTGYDDVLKAVDLPIVSNERCIEMHRGNLRITNSKICAGGRRNEGVCERDYGGPLICQDGHTKVIVGISVHGRGCARANQPGIFINVPFYTQWIHKVFKYYPNPEVI
ncbi:hepatocyte growth factor [Synchiropus splendidus]|uniref:hepatocyte growth factor n=1 Tax=Synchiropus splendidus TaxID=270530 RepID=UPI00237EB1B4|nr:hepatocyte growth factor [Synchiropus splendidus]